MKLGELIEELQTMREYFDDDTDVMVMYVNEFMRPEKHKDVAGTEVMEDIESVGEFLKKDSSTGILLTLEHEPGMIEGEYCNVEV